MGKPKVAFFDFTCCEGCQIEFTNYGDAAFLELIKHVDVVEFREAMSEKTTEPIDVALVEGSFSREADRARLESIRERAAVVIAYGQCAASGGINALKNHQDDYRQYVYGDDAGQPHLDSQDALPISAAIKVDYSAYGCPVNKYEVLQIVFHLLHGKEPVIPNYPVCVECKRRESVCRFAEGRPLHGHGGPCRVRGAVPRLRGPLRGLPRVRRSSQRPRPRAGAGAACRVLAEAGGREGAHVHSE